MKLYIVSFACEEAFGIGVSKPQLFKTLSDAVEHVVQDCLFYGDDESDSTDERSKEMAEEVRLLSDDDLKKDGHTLYLEDEMSLRIDVVTTED